MWRPAGDHACANRPIALHAVLPFHRTGVALVGVQSTAKEVKRRKALRGTWLDERWCCPVLTASSVAVVLPVPGGLRVALSSAALRTFTGMSSYPDEHDLGVLHDPSRLCRFEPSVAASVCSSRVLARVVASALRSGAEWL